MTDAAAHERAKERLLPSYWAEQHRRIDGRPWSFEGRQFLRDIHDDRARLVVVKKAAQLGFTEALQNIAVHAVDFGTATMIVFPTDDTAKRHSKARFKTLMEGSPYIASIFREVDAIDVKRSREAALYFEGSNSGDALYSVPVGVLIIDEVDRCDQAALRAATHRLDGHAAPVELHVSTPTVPNVGVDAEFARSDQKRWHVQCPRGCGWAGPLDGEGSDPTTWAILHWPGKPVIPTDEPWRVAADACLCCPDCGHHWTERERLAAVEAGRWIAGNPGAPVSGYAINQLCSPTRSIPEIVGQFFDAYHDLNPEALQQFINQTLGRPYLGESESITREQVEALTVPATPRTDYGPCIGADPGRVIHVAQGERATNGTLIVRRYLELPGWDQLHQLMRSETILRAVVDRYPEASKSEEFCTAFPTVAYRAEHPEGMREVYTWDTARQVVQIREVDAVDILLARIRRARLLIERRGIWEQAVRHMTHINVVAGTDRRGNAIRRVAHKVGGRDDLALATIYLDAAASLVSLDTADPGWKTDPGVQHAADLYAGDVPRIADAGWLSVPDLDIWDERRLEWERF